MMICLQYEVGRETERRALWPPGLLGVPCFGHQTSHTVEKKYFEAVAWNADADANGSKLIMRLYFVCVHLANTWPAMKHVWVDPIVVLMELERVSMVPCGARHPQPLS